MIEKDINLDNEQSEKETNVREFVLDDFKIDSISSAETIRREQNAAKIPTEDEKIYSAAKEISPQNSVDAALIPFVRVMFSNTVATPRKNPSPLRDYSPLFIVSANQFAEVLDVSGFQQDAFEVALAGDDIKFTEDATENAFYQFIGKQENDFTQNNSSEIRFALLALASGIVLENLRGQISKNLFLKLQENVEKLSAEKALSALQENFGVFSDEMTEEFFTPTVFGTSLINFPRVSRKKFVPKFAPLSSSGSAFK
ncbi:MAG: hypothetical protein LC778_00615 [Acidobacteria bacterium]|nr:hypothetical protein [Acidobacteriota bacterium]